MLYGSLGYFGMSLISENLSVCNMLFWRFLISSLSIILFIYLSKQNLNYFSKQNFKLFIYAAIFYGSSSAFYFASSTYIGTGLSMVILFIYPTIIIAFNALFYKQKIDKLYYVSMSLIIVGMILLVNQADLSFNLLGISLSIISAIEYAAYIIYSKRYSTTPPITAALMVSLGSCFGCLIFALFEGSFYLPSNNFQIWINFITIGIVCTSLPILFMLKGLKYISAEKASLLSVVEPVCVGIAGILLLNESINLHQLFGVIIILIGAIICIKIKY
jgi:drug/metabolite transporter (DMT)-like permease